MLNLEVLVKLYGQNLAETHPGPHSEWFWDLEQAGGGCILDLGCHCIEISRNYIGKDIKPIEVMCWRHTGKTY